MNFLFNPSIPWKDKCEESEREKIFIQLSRGYSIRENK